MTSFLHRPGGYDSDVEREKKMDYTSKIYSNPIHEAGQGVKPHRQEERSQQAGTRGRPAVRRTATPTPRVATSERNVEVTVRVQGGVYWNMVPQTISSRKLTFYPFVKYGS